MTSTRTNASRPSRTALTSSGRGVAMAAELTGPTVAPWAKMVADRRPPARRRSPTRGGVVSAPPQPASAGRETVRTVAPKLIELTEQVVYGDVWERPGLSKRDRSLITVAALIALERREQLP